MHSHVMTNRHLHKKLLLSWALLIVPLVPAVAIQELHKEIPRGKEKTLYALIDISFGTLTIERGEPEKLAVVDYQDENDDSNKLQVSYSPSGDEGRLKIRLRKSSKFWRDEDDEGDSHDRKLKLKFSDALPITLEIELGAGRGDIDLTGLQVKDLKVSTGASSVTLRCDEPNRISANNITIESGVSKFTATNLCNTNFRTLKFSGGVGSYKLDFGGTPRQRADAHIEVGLGSVSVTVPKHVATRLLYDENWFSSFDVDRGFTKERSGVYVSDESNREDNVLTIQIESGLGSVKVRRK